MVNYQDITNLINESDDDFESFDEFERILKAALKANKQNREGTNDDIIIPSKKPKKPFLTEEEKEKLRKEIERERKKHEPTRYVPTNKNRSDVENRRRIAAGIGGALAIGTSASIIRDLWKRRQQNKQMMQR